MQAASSAGRIGTNGEAISTIIISSIRRRAAGARGSQPNRSSRVTSPTASKETGRICWKHARIHISDISNHQTIPRQEEKEGGGAGDPGLGLAWLVHKMGVRVRGSRTMTETGNPSLFTGGSVVCVQSVLPDY